LDTIVTTGSRETRAAKVATSSIPIVMTLVADPVGEGIVASLARPGGNVTGLTTLVPGPYQKYVEFLHEIVPSPTRFAGRCGRGRRVERRGSVHSLSPSSVVGKAVAAGLPPSYPLRLICGDRTLKAAACDPAEAVRWGLLHEQCTFAADDFSVTSSLGRFGWSQPYRHLVVVRYTPTAEFVVEQDLAAYLQAPAARAAYDPDRLIRPDHPLPVRACTMLALTGC
jgi:hypothetical protein